MSATARPIQTWTDESEQAIPRSGCDVPLKSIMYQLEPPVTIDKLEIEKVLVQHITPDRAPARPTPRRVVIAAGKGHTLVTYYMSRDEDVYEAILVAFKKFNPKIAVEK